MTATDDVLRLITLEVANISKETIKNNINREEWTLRWLFAFFRFWGNLVRTKAISIGYFVTYN